LKQNGPFRVPVFGCLLREVHPRYF
jgi:hypothetical protein